MVEIPFFFLTKSQIYGIINYKGKRSEFNGSKGSWNEWRIS